MPQTAPNDSAVSIAELPAVQNSQAGAESSSSATAASMTQQQADEMISLLKSIKQNMFILTLVAGFFALRAIVFHH
ncbi:MAG: hypothetical protein F6K00_21420 [Leptolyngbya sp. SIOISBB]|nr:hypothetical protein [Leptolyngbya sp. SIOISBB]